MPEFVNGFRNKQNHPISGEIVRIRPILAKGFQNKANSASSGPNWGMNREIVLNQADYVLY